MLVVILVQNTAGDKTITLEDSVSLWGVKKTKKKGFKSYANHRKHNKTFCSLR